MTQTPARPSTRTAVPPRQSQASRREATTTRILDATVACLVELGHARTSTLVVQERAGVSRGALLHHFPSRAELLAATVDHLFDKLSTLDPAVTRLADPIEIAVRSLWASFTSDLYVASQELWTAARTDAELREALVRGEADLNRKIRAMYRGIFGPELVARPRFDTTFRLLVEAMRGAAAHRALQPEASAKADIARWVDVATLLLAAE